MQQMAMHVQQEKLVFVWQQVVRAFDAPEITAPPPTKIIGFFA